MHVKIQNCLRASWFSGSFFKPMKDDTPNKETLYKSYESLADTRHQTAKDLEDILDDAFSSLPSPPTIKVRIKKFQSYYKKYIQLLKNGITCPQITDLMGIRIICPFIEDLKAVEEIINKQFKVIETDHKGHHNFSEFGYESTHLLIEIPEAIIKTRGQTGCSVAEIQIRTILQDAWAEVEHELYYKTEFNPVDTPMKRKLAAVNANLTLVDWVFQEIRDYQKQLDGQLEKRRGSFYQKVEEETDALLFSNIPTTKTNLMDTPVIEMDNLSIDELLLKALRAHNENRYEEAMIIYSRILELNPVKKISSLIYKHRGMAYFAQSRYQEAVDDFTIALAHDVKSYKAAYYRGVVRSVLRLYSEAIDDYTLSLELNPYQAFCLFRRGQAFYHIGDYPQALSDCEGSLAIEPNNETIKEFCELLKRKLKM